MCKSGRVPVLEEWQSLDPYSGRGVTGMRSEELMRANISNAPAMAVSSTISWQFMCSLTASKAASLAACPD